MNRVRTRAGPEKLQCRDNAELVKTREVLRIRKLNVRDGVRQAAVAVRLARRCNAVQRLLHRLIADRMHMHDETLLVRRNR